MEQSCRLCAEQKAWLEYYDRALFDYIYFSSYAMSVQKRWITNVLLVIYRCELKDIKVTNVSVVAD